MELGLDVHGGRRCVADLVQARVGADVFTGAGSLRCQGVEHGLAGLVAFAGQIVGHDAGARHDAVEGVGVDGHMQVSAPGVGLLHSALHRGGLVVDDLEAAALQCGLAGVCDPTTLHCLVGITRGVQVAVLVARR